jgi:hypothetical protein
VFVFGGMPLLSCVGMSQSWVTQRSGQTVMRNDSGRGPHSAGWGLLLAYHGVAENSSIVSSCVQRRTLTARA